MKKVATKILSALLLFSVTASCVTLLSSCSERQNEFSFYGLDTLIELKLSSIGKKEDEEIRNTVESEVGRYEKIFSRTDEDAELYKINHSDKTTFTVSDDLADLLLRAIGISQSTDGAFDFTCGSLTELWKISDSDAPIPGAEEVAEAMKHVGYDKVSLDGNTLVRPCGLVIDLGAIAKGYIEGKITDLLISKGVERGILSFGGNISVFGEKRDKSEYRIAIRNPYGESGHIGYVTTLKGYVSVCGTYERNKIVDGVFYHHIFDPKNGYPKDTDVISVALICDDGALADALSTALFVMGDGAQEWILSCGYDIGAVFFAKDKTVRTMGNVNYISDR